jgi:hypothetical protein
MPRSNNQRKRYAKCNNHDQKQIKIPSQALRVRRTLTRSAREQMERERAPKLWIFPSDKFVYSVEGKATAYPRASLLGLPKEIREQILIYSYSMEDLKRDTFAFNPTDKKAAKKVIKGGRLPLDLLGSKSSTLMAKVTANSKEDQLLEMLHRRIGDYSRISPAIRQEMLYVAEQWHDCVVRFLEQERHKRANQPPIPAAVLPAPGAPVERNSRGQIIKVAKQKSGKKLRPMKCWDCGRRHHGIDPICPMARDHPEKWLHMTKKVSGKRAEAAASQPQTQLLKRIIFED